MYTFNVGEMSCGVRFQEKPRLKNLCFFETPVRYTFVYTNPILFFLQTMDEDVKFKQMTTGSRQAAFIYHYGRCKEGELERGAMTEAARLFSVVTPKAMALEPW